MKRRGFLGIMGGAVVAGPGAAKQAVTAASRASTGGVASLGNGLSPPMGIISGARDGVTGTHKSWLLERVAELRRMISGDLTDEEIEERRVSNEMRKVKFEIEVSGLRSMSETAKYNRMSRFANSQSEARERFYMKRQLKEYLEQAGMA
jgi:hypothetical protein